MTELKRKDIRDTVQILIQLDKNNLLLIDTGAKLLLARQNMDKEDTKTSVTRQRYEDKGR